MILRGELTPGTPLREIPMATSIGISRNTAREAVRVLVRQGLVTHTMHRGAIVTCLTERDIADLFRVRHAVETEAIEASGRADAEQLRELAAAVEALEHATEQDDWGRIVELDCVFHERLVGFLGSPRINRFFGTIQGELRLCLSIVDPEDDNPAALAAEHRELYELIAAGERDRCASLMRAHLTDAEQRLRAIAREWDRTGESTT
jgi:DNA-binding GntR family transcriptional regulator